MALTIQELSKRKLKRRKSLFSTPVKCVLTAVTLIVPFLFAKLLQPNNITRLNSESVVTIKDDDGHRKKKKIIAPLNQGSKTFISPKERELPSFKQPFNASKSSWILDFMIVGWPKCGTTSLMNYLNTDELFVPTREIRGNIYSILKQVLRNYKQTQEKNPNYKDGMKHGLWGIKDPFIIYDAKLLKSFPHAKLIVGVRHPVLWFESFWNHVGVHEYSKRYSDNNLPSKNSSIMNFSQRIGSYGGSFSLDTNTARYHAALMKLGKTNLTSKDEMALFPEDVVKVIKIINDNKRYQKMPNKVFIYELRQLSDENETRKRAFRKDLGNFLGVSTPLPHLVKVDPNVYKE